MILLNRRIQILSVMALLIPAAYQGSEPQALSIAPLGGQRGARLEATLRGQSLQGAYAVWFDREGVTATVERVEEVAAGGESNPSEDPSKVQKLILGLQIDRSAGTGRYQLRVVSPQGVSGPLAFLVHDLPSVTESKRSSGPGSKAQPVRFPCAIDGIVSQPGERDLYALQAAEDQQLRFELISNPSGKSMGGRAGYNGGFDSALTLYQPRGSWFEEGRFHRLAYDDKSKAKPRPNPRIETRVRQPGLYLLEVGSFYNLGGPEFTYQLRVTPNGPAAPERPPATANGSGPEPWRERSFSRPIRPDHIQRILARTVETGNGAGADSAGNGGPLHEKESDSGQTAYSIIREQEPNEGGGPVSGSDCPLPGGGRDRPTRRRGQAGFLSGPTRTEAQLRAGDPRGDPARLQPSAGPSG